MTGAEIATCIGVGVASLGTICGAIVWVVRREIEPFKRDIISLKERAEERDEMEQNQLIKLYEHLRTIETKIDKFTESMHSIELKYVSRTECNKNKAECSARAWVSAQMLKDKS